MADQLGNFIKNKYKKKTSDPLFDFSAKDWSTFIISLLALLISGTTAYFSQLQLVENLEGTVIFSPSLSVDFDQRLRLRGPFDVAFVNNGNRPIAVLDAQFLLNQIKLTRDEAPTDEKASCFGGDEVTGIAIVTEPFVVEPSKVTIRQFKSDHARRTAPKLAPHNLRSTEISVVGCLQLRVVTAQGTEFVTDSFGVWYVKNSLLSRPLFRPPLPNGPGGRVPMIFLDRSKLRFLPG